MPKIKARAGKLKDPECFYSFKAEEKYKEFIEPQKILKEKAFQFPKQLIGTMNTIFTTAVHNDWVKFFAHRRPNASKCQGVLL